MPVIGFLHTASPGPFVQLMAAFRHGLAEVGFVEGQNLAIEYRWAEGQTDRLPALATDLMRRQVGVIVALGGELPALAAKAGDLDDTDCVLGRRRSSRGRARG
jgi:putative tryptophan/tyrosine transport system substrate-binding protein